MKNQQLIAYLESNNISYESNVDLRRKTWIHRGGIASLFIIPRTHIELQLISKYLFCNGIQFLVLGYTSNLYIKNTTNIEVAVSTKKCNFYEISNGQLICEAGVSVISLSKDMIRRGIKGFEYLTGLPGTVSAALCNNSSCKSNSISALLQWAEVVDNKGNLRVLTSDDFCFGFRTSLFKQNTNHGVITSIALRVEYGDVNELQQIAIENEKKRKKSLSGYAHNLGCVVDHPCPTKRMAFRYRLVGMVVAMFSKISKNAESTAIKKHWFCKLSHCEIAEPYISNLNPLVFMWLDEKADEAFPYYLKFMEKVYKTKDIEIEIL